MNEHIFTHNNHTHPQITITEKSQDSKRQNMIWKHWNIINNNSRRDGGEVLIIVECIRCARPPSPYLAGISCQSSPWAGEAGTATSLLGGNWSLGAAQSHTESSEQASDLVRLHGLRSWPWHHTVQQGTTCFHIQPRITLARLKLPRQGEATKIPQRLALNPVSEAALTRILWISGTIKCQARSGPLPALKHAFVSKILIHIFKGFIQPTPPWIQFPLEYI